MKEFLLSVFAVEGLGTNKRTVATRLRKGIGVRVKQREARIRQVRKKSNQILTLVLGCWLQGKRIQLEMDGQDFP